MERVGQTVPPVEELQFYRSISLEQFAILHERIDTLYLHDFSLPGDCSRLFHQKVLYGKVQKIRVPSGIASYDLIQGICAFSSSYANA